MNSSAKQVVIWTRDSIRTLATYPQYARSNTLLYNELRDISGLSFNHIAGFVRDEAYNITVEKLDRLMNAVKALQRKCAA